MLTSEQRNSVMQQLQSKCEYWRNPETKFLFFKGFTTNPQIPDFAIERDDNGYFYLSDELIAYCDLRNGYICRMRKKWRAEDWECYNELYQASENTKEFRIDIPRCRAIITVGEDDWEYAELQSPNNDYGLNFNDDVFEWPELTNGVEPNKDITSSYQDQIADYHKEFVDHAYVILKHADQIAKKYGVGLPKNLGRPSTRFRDDIGYFWSDFDQDEWEVEKEKAIIHYLGIFERTLIFAKLCGVLDDTRVDDVLQYAREKWITI
jgi:hypothetical protein